MKDLVFVCKTCGCEWERSYVRNPDGSSPPKPERFSLVDGQVPKSCCEAGVGYSKLRIKVTGEVDPRVHAGEPMYPGLGALGWHSDGGCSYCGSLSVPEAIRLLKTPGSQFSGTDKTGYKAYIGDHQKFYFRHLRASSDAELAEFNVLARKIFGLSFDRPDGDIRCQYPQGTGFYGWQTFGHIGDDGEPVFHKGSPTPPPMEFWT
jgi:hypothetical protein